MRTANLNSARRFYIRFEIRRFEIRRYKIQDPARSRILLLGECLFPAFLVGACPCMPSLRDCTVYIYRIPQSHLKTKRKKVRNQTSNYKFRIPNITRTSVKPLIPSHFATTAQLHSEDYIFIHMNLRVRSVIL